MTEWRAIDGWQNYEVSDDGQVRCLTPRGGGDPRVLKQGALPKTGYRYVSLGTRKTRQSAYVHQLVCRAFYGPAPSAKHEVAHWDGTRANNRAENVRWATRKENRDDQRRHGTLLMGERQNGAKLKPSQVLEIRRLFADGIPQHKIAADFGIAQSNVSMIVTRTNWRHI